MSDNDDFGAFFSGLARQTGPTRSLDRFESVVKFLEPSAVVTVADLADLAFVDSKFGDVFALDGTVCTDCLAPNNAG